MPTVKRCSCVRRAVTCIQAYNTHRLLKVKGVVVQMNDLQSPEVQFLNWIYLAFLEISLGLVGAHDSEDYADSVVLVHVNVDRLSHLIMTLAITTTRKFLSIIYGALNIGK